MTVYFVALRSDRKMVKIGVTKQLDRRMQALSCAAPVVLFATCDGDKVEERYFQKRFAALRVEGEWFEADEAMMKFIAENSTPCHVEYGKADVRWSLRKPENGKRQDGAIAHVLLRRHIGSLPREITLAGALEEIFHRLSGIGEGWTRRRVRSLYEQTALRVDVHEMVDLLKFSDVPENQWANWLRGEVHHQEVENSRLKASAHRETMAG